MLSKIIFPSLLMGILFYAPGQKCFAQINSNVDRESSSISADSSFFIGGVSLSLLRKGQVELNSTSQISSYQWGIKKLAEASPIVNRFRTTQFITRMDAYLGMSESGRWDLGLRAEYNRTRIDDNATASPFDVFLSSDNTTIGKQEFGKSYGGLSRLGVRFRLKPFAKNDGFTVLGGYAVTTLKSEELQRNLQAESDQVDLSLIYSKTISPRVYYYFALSGFFNPSNRVDTIANYSSALSFYLVNLSLNNKLVFYPGLTYAVVGEPILVANGNRQLAWTYREITGFLGLQFQLSRSFVLSASYSIPITREFSNRWFSFITPSHTAGSLSARFLF